MSASSASFDVGHSSTGRVIGRGLDAGFVLR